MDGSVTGKVFGIGLSKTGTTSLDKALNALGIKTVHFPDDETTYQEIFHGEYSLSVLRTSDGIVDLPAGLYYAEFDRLFPGAKFVLTLREKSSWLQSAAEHWRRASESTGHEERFYGRLQKYLGYSEFIDLATYGTLHFDPDRFSAVYDRHVEGVRRYFADRPGDLLELDICGGEGWERLCPFLGWPIPTLPFPHLNRSRPQGPDDVRDLTV